MIQNLEHTKIQMNIKPNNKKRKRHKINKNDIRKRKKEIIVSSYIQIIDF